MENININQGVKFGLIESIILCVLALYTFLEQLYYMFNYGRFSLFVFIRFAAELAGFALIVLFFHSFNIKINGTK